MKVIEEPFEGKDILSRDEFYNNLRRNKFVVVPDKDLLEEAS
jgi:hypothetical protein